MNHIVFQVSPSRWKWRAYCVHNRLALPAQTDHWECRDCTSPYRLLLPVMLRQRELHVHQDMISASVDPVKALPLIENGLTMGIGRIGNTQDYTFRLCIASLKSSRADDAPAVRRHKPVLAAQRSGVIGVCTPQGGHIPVRFLKRNTAVAAPAEKKISVRCRIVPSFDPLIPFETSIRIFFVSLVYHRTSSSRLSRNVSHISISGPNASGPRERGLHCG